MARSRGSTALLFPGQASPVDGQRELGRLRVDTPRNDYVATLDAVAGVVAALEARVPRPDRRLALVGIGIPGALSPSSGRVKNANSTWLIGQMLQQDLETWLGRSVRIANDADCFALSEATDGAAAGAAVVFGVIIGTGVGGGIVVRGQLLAGPNALAGEWGHNPLPWAGADESPGPRCYCGRRGCLETALSGPGLAADHERHTGELVQPAAIVERAAFGDPAAGRTLERYEHRLARALASVINLLDPDVIVLGGGLSKIERLYTRVPSLWSEWVFNAAAGRSPDADPFEFRATRVESRPRTRLVPAAHGDASGVRGAAWLWPAETIGVGE